MKRTLNEMFNRFLGESHIVGNSLPDGIRAVRRAQQAGWATTLGFWDSPEETPASVANHYLKALDGLANTGGRCRFSIRPLALAYDFDLLKEVLQKAKEMMIPLLFDADFPDNAARSFALFEQACAEYWDVGFTLPARWDISLSHAERIIGMQKTVRLVKGQWNDAGRSDGHVRSRFLRLAAMFQQGKSRVVIATHDKPLAAAALNTLLESNVLCELEQMFGLPWRNIVGEEEYYVVRRMYIPYGTPYLPYNIPFLRERLSILYWVLRDCLLRRRKKLEMLGMPIDDRMSSFGAEKDERVLREHSSIAVEGKR